MSTNDPFTPAQPESLDADTVSQPRDTGAPDFPAAQTQDSSASQTQAAGEQSSVAYGESDALAWDQAFSDQEYLAQPKSDLDDLTFDDDKPQHAAEKPASEKPEETADTAQPLAAGATFASAYAATGVTELSEAAQPEQAAAAEQEASEPPVRTSAFESVTPPTLTAPAAAVAASAGEPATSSWGTDPGTPNLTDLPDQPKGRVGAHIGSIFATLLLIPLAWYLISDAGVRLNLVQNNPWDTGNVSIAVIFEFAGAMLSVFLLWLMARASSLGAQLWGIVLTIAGLVPIFAPKLGVQLVDILDEAIGGYNAFTGNVVHHLALDLGSGRVAIFGFIIFLTGIMIHLARKSAAQRAEAIALREHVLGE